MPPAHWLGLDFGLWWLPNNFVTGHCHQQLSAPNLKLGPGPLTTSFIPAHYTMRSPRVSLATVPTLATGATWWWWWWWGGGGVAGNLSFRSNAVPWRMQHGTVRGTLGHSFITVKLHGEHHTQHWGAAIENQLSQPSWGRTGRVLSAPPDGAIICYIDISHQLTAIIDNLLLVCSPHLMNSRSLDPCLKKINRFFTKHKILQWFGLNSCTNLMRSINISILMFLLDCF